MEIQINTEMPAEFTLTNKDNKMHPLVHPKVLEGRKLLGVYIAVDSNEKAQESYLIRKAKEYTK